MLEINLSEILRKLRQIDKDIPVYVITNVSPIFREYYNGLLEAMDNGYNFEIIQKPIDKNELLYVLENLN